MTDLPALLGPSTVSGLTVSVAYNHVLRRNVRLPIRRLTSRRELMTLGRFRCTRLLSNRFGDEVLDMDRVKTGAFAECE